MSSADATTPSSYPPGGFLFLSKMIDLATAGSDWRRHVPFGWADPPHGWFSGRVGNAVGNFPPLLSYAEYLRSSGADSPSSWSPRTLFDYAFGTDSTRLGDLTSYESMAVLLVAVLALRSLKARSIPRFSEWGRRAGRATHGPEWERGNEDRIKKFGEYVFRVMHHSAMSAYGVWYFWDKPWWDVGSEAGGTKLLYLEHPAHPIEVGMAWYYLAQSAYNAESLLSLLQLSFVVELRSPVGKSGLRSPVAIGWSPAVRGDFREMFVHHLVTNALIVGSSYFRFTRIGSMVFLVHDTSDVPVGFSKLANFLKWKRATAVCFVSMVLVWLVTRLGVFPFVIYRSVLFESWLLVSANGLDPIYYYCYRHLFFILIGLILLLHLAWFLMFIRMGWLLVSRGETHDLSEHKKGEDQRAVVGAGADGAQTTKEKAN